MRINRLDLMAFGHFTGVELDFAGGPGAVHLVYGPNEAGKSTALRALRALFYGIEARSADGFLHDFDKLRIGALVEHSDGAVIDFVRRKGTKNTFLNRDGKPGDEAALQNAIRAVDDDLFTSLFGINHERLVAGGHGILKGGGDVGQSLFAAGLGGASLRDVLERLDSEAAGLFKPSGQNQTINRACREYKEAKDEIVKHALATRDYEERSATLQHARQERDRVATELTSLRSNTNRLERIVRAVRRLPERRVLRERLKQLADVPLLPENFAGERLSVVATLASAGAESATKAEKIADLDARIAALRIPDNLISRADAITELHQRLGSHRKAERDLPALRAEHRTLDKDAKRLLDDLRLEQPESSRISRAATRKVQALANQHQALVEKRDAAVRKSENIARDLAALESEQGTLPDVSVLREAVGEAQRLGDLEDELVRRRDAARSAETSAENAFHRLSLWTGTLDEVSAFAAPSIETIDRFEKEWLAADNSASQTAERLREAKTKISRCEREIEELLRSGSVPTESELADARARREQKWQEVRSALLMQSGTTEDHQSLTGAYEAEVGSADDLSDRLRREATRVAQHAHLLAERDQFNRDTDDLEAASTKFAADIALSGEQWRGLWPAIEPLPPREMRAWLQKLTRLFDQIAELNERRDAVTAVEERIAQHRAALLTHLPDAAAHSLRMLISRGQQLVEKADIVRRDIKKLTTAGQAASVEKDETHAALGKWEAEWHLAMVEIGQTETATPGDASDFIATCAELQGKLEGADRLRARIKAIESDAAIFERDAAAAVAQVTPDEAAGQGDEAITELYERLRKANHDAATRAALATQREEAGIALEEAKRTVLAEGERLAAMCRQAGCADPADLEAIERQSQEAESKRAKLDEIEEWLQTESAGTDLENFIAEIEQMNSDTMAAEIAENVRQIADREEQLSKFAEQVGSEETLLKAMDGNARAAEASEKAQAVLGQLEEQSERYIRLRLASAILRKEIERYRTENQDPLLARASELFRELTLGSFASIATDFNAGDNPILIGVRASGKKVTVDGMSEGTRDQLFLALQLANLEKFIASCEPMPFIVDDVLIGFDHDREAAVLKVLTELSKKTQVIIFTHHYHLVELARRTLPEDAVAVHELPTPYEETSIIASICATGLLK